MLLQFRVKNYRSIGDEVVIDLVAGSGREHSEFLFEQNGVKILPVASLYGGNAGGKSNIANAILGMFKNITLSQTFGQASVTLTTPFLYDETLANEPTEMEMFIALDGREYQYGYTATRNKVLEEWLFYRKISKNETKSYPVFYRKDGICEFAPSFENLTNYENLVGEKTLAISVLGNIDNAKLGKKAKFFNDIYRWTRRNYAFSDLGFLGTGMSLRLYSEKNEIKVSLFKFLQEFDFTLETLDIREEVNSSGETFPKVYTKHNKKWYPFEIESTGTQKLFYLYFSIFSSLHLFQSTLVFDELDTHLHPLIMRRIVNMFHDKETNKMKSQLIMTAHNLIIMDKNELRRDEIWFVEKDNKGFTRAYSLDSFKSTEDEMRSDMSYGKHYLAGRFGAIPYARVKNGG